MVCLREGGFCQGPFRVDGEVKEPKPQSAEQKRYYKWIALDLPAMFLLCSHRHPPLRGACSLNPLIPPLGRRRRIPASAREAEMALRLLPPDWRLPVNLVSTSATPAVVKFRGRNTN
jgi:hypothetical protein